MYDAAFDFLGDMSSVTDLFENADWYDMAVDAGTDFTNWSLEDIPLSDLVGSTETFLDGDWYDAALQAGEDAMNSGSSWMDSVLGGAGKLLGAGVAAGAKGLGSRSGGNRSAANAASGRVSSGISVDNLPTRAMAEAKGPQPLRSESPATVHGFWTERMRTFARLKDMIDGTSRATSKSAADL